MAQYKKFTYYGMPIESLTNTGLQNALKQAVNSLTSNAIPIDKTLGVIDAINAEIKRRNSVAWIPISELPETSTQGKLVLAKKDSFGNWDFSLATEHCSSGHPAVYWYIIGEKGVHSMQQVMDNYKYFMPLFLSHD